MANAYFKQFFYTKHAYPVMLDCSFTVTPTNGAGVTALSGAGISNVFMHTSTTPVTGNPNPANGEIIVQLSDNYKKFLGIDFDFRSQLVGTPSTSTTTNVINVITALGTATLANWQTVGLPIGITPAVGVAFVATSSAVIGGSATVDLRAVAGAGIDHLEVVGNPSLTLTNSTIQNPALQQSAGGYIYLAAFKNTALTAPTTGAIIDLSIYLSNSSNTVS